MGLTSCYLNDNACFFKLGQLSHDDHKVIAASRLLRAYIRRSPLATTLTAFFFFLLSHKVAIRLTVHLRRPPQNRENREEGGLRPPICRVQFHKLSCVS